MVETNIYSNTQPGYPVILGQDLLSQRGLTQQITSTISQIIIITDAHVAKLYANTLKVSLSVYQTHVIAINPGELSKTRETKAWVEDQMFALNCGRDCLIVALGGGVVTDLGGFIAATYMRGVPIIYCPTTLLAMVDASIGSKTGLNTSAGKNLIGTFTQPKAVIMDIKTLHTLANDEYLNAFSEMIKHALIADVQYFDWLYEHAEQLKQREEHYYVFEAIKRSIEIKLKFVSEDLTDQGRRKFLNLGHTTAHAIEQVSNYQVPHGQAVAMGIVSEAELAVKEGILSKQEYDKISLIFERFKLPIHIPDNLDQNDIKNVMQMDKKNTGGQIKKVYISAIGVPHE